jgi:hypothetical protein
VQLSGPTGESNPGQARNPTYLESEIPKCKLLNLPIGKITNADTLTIELIEPPGMPPVVRPRWPAKLSITTPDAYGNVAAGTMRILAAAVTELSAIRFRKKL